ncbi:MAG: glycosyltransferase [Planctomycetota bacterium]|nr:MAG: glycosyltransferase [Planctomycetota bacterium]
MRCCVIMTTYNQPAWLEKVLWGFAYQCRRPDQVIVADDGSKPETLERLRALAPQLNYSLLHLWQRDEGFRKCQALNHAVRLCDADYCIFTDADCIPHRDFVAWHCHLARPRRFLSGGYNKLSMDTSTLISPEDIAAGRHCDPRWLAEHGSPHLAREAKLRHCGSRWGRALDALTTTKPSWNGHNASTWRSYILAANGFDHEMQYGGQDREFGERLTNAGIRGLQMRHRATCVHLDHGRGYATPESIAKNRAIRAETRRSVRTRADQGLAQVDEDDCQLNHFRCESSLR